MQRNALYLQGVSLQGGNEVRIRIEAWRQDYNAFRRMKPLKTRRPKSSSAGSLINNFRLYPRHKRWAQVNGSAYISECAKDARHYTLNRLPR